VADLLRRARRFVALDQETFFALELELPAVLAGTPEPAGPARLMKLAYFGTHYKQRFVEVAALFQRCFARHPDWMTASGEPRPRTPQTAGRFVAFGSLPGTFAMALERPDGVLIAVLFNQRRDSSGLAYESIEGVMNRAAEGVQRWP
jgi:hypothetical protein